MRHAQPPGDDSVIRHSQSAKIPTDFSKNIVIYVNFFLLQNIVIYVNFLYLCGMETKRKIRAYKTYFQEFMSTLTPAQRRKVDYSIDMLRSQDRVSAKFVKHIRDGLFELRAEYEGNIFRVFFIFDGNDIVVLFSGFQKKTQQTPEREIKKALSIKNEYYGIERNK